MMSSLIGQRCGGRRPTGRITDHPDLSLPSVRCSTAQYIWRTVQHSGYTTTTSAAARTPPVSCSSHNHTIKPEHGRHVDIRRASAQCALRGTDGRAAHRSKPHSSGRAHSPHVGVCFDDLWHDFCCGGPLQPTTDHYEPLHRRCGSHCFYAFTSRHV